tara:strand:- start:1586 stop:1945 length:360 start_codon:yes stop_codon:yes gene_type:complete
MIINNDLITRILFSLMYGVSVYGNLFIPGKFNESINYVKSIGFPLPKLSVICGLLIKGFGVYSILTTNYINYALPLLIGFTIMVTILFNNPVQFPEKKWMFFTLLAVIGGLIRLYNENK